ncbi:OmpH family outer membrane protein [Panacibacter ginsenosidivorans]|uniref:OmpH family outer membrane protein n=1 Tax=Panacibacter ginsenosidivorans TaxID=1813871 RepID=A0A5B8VCC3_9BACT|nr:OmpH family outer membrane protein [Panacibacter ginsenosidivorans]QEC68909.1 OmpH family outer membrane protein [Panacibacter ginsenosidivorans]
MNKFLLGLNLVLVIAVGVLYYMYFDYTRSDIHDRQHAQAAAANTFKIAYFELDSLQTNYEYYKEVKDYLTKKDSDYGQQLNAIRNRYQNKLKEYQDKGPTLSQSQQSDYEQQLMKLQNDYQTTEANINSEMQAEMLEKLQGVKMKIQDFLKAYCANKGYAYVFASSKDDDIYYKDTIRNITDSIIIGLNEQYKASKTK